MMRKIPIEVVYLLIILIACSFATEKKNLEFSIVPKFNQEKVRLSESRFITANGDTIQIQQLKFYISQLEFNFQNGKTWKEKNSFHLLEMNEDTLPTLFFKKFPGEKISSISFNFGIDSITSVSGALEGDLDPAKGMYWSWNSGYINAKLEGMYTSKLNKKFEFHIGGYLPKERAVRKVVIPVSEQNGKISITMDLSRCFQHIHLAQQDHIVTAGKEAMKMADAMSGMFY